MGSGFDRKKNDLYKSVNRGFYDMVLLDHSALFASYDAVQTEKTKQSLVKNTPRNALQAFLHTASQAKTGSGFQRMQRCRCALIA